MATISITFLKASLEAASIGETASKPICLNFVLFLVNITNNFWFEDAEQNTEANQNIDKYDAIGQDTQKNLVAIIKDLVQK